MTNLRELLHLWSAQENAIILLMLAAIGKTEDDVLSGRFKPTLYQYKTNNGYGDTFAYALGKDIPHNGYLTTADLLVYYDVATREVTVYREPALSGTVYPDAPALGGDRRQDSSPS